MIVTLMVGPQLVEMIGVGYIGTTYKPTVFGSTGLVYDHQDLPTEPKGAFTLTLTNLIAGSAIRIETQAGALVEFRTSALSSEVFTVPAYATGNASNNLRIKVRKGSAAPFYIAYETLATAFVGAQTIFVSQIPDE